MASTMNQNEIRSLRSIKSYHTTIYGCGESIGDKESEGKWEFRIHWIAHSNSESSEILTKSWVKRIL